MQTITTRALEPAPHRRFDGYEIVRPLGSGGMATVYLARDVGLGRMVAVKLGPTRKDPKARARFALETRALGSVRHANVVEAIHAGEVDDQAYLVTEYVEGRALHELLRPQRWTTVVRIGVELARALEAVHDGGWLHRDVKPSNVMLTDDGGVKLIDFGLARTIDAHMDDDVVGFLSLAAGSPSVHLTATDCIAGTPRYLAPELWRRKPATVRSDVYAMGLVLHELLAGTLPHNGLKGDALPAFVTQNEMPLPLEAMNHVPGPLVALIDRCVRIRADERPESATEVRERLETLQRGCRARPTW